MGEKAAQLQKHSLKTSLNRKIKSRPGPLDLVTKKILQVDAELEQAIQGGWSLYSCHSARSLIYPVYCILSETNEKKVEAIARAHPTIYSASLFTCAHNCVLSASLVSSYADLTSRSRNEWIPWRSFFTLPCSPFSHMSLCVCGCTWWLLATCGSDHNEVVSYPLVRERNRDKARDRHESDR